VRFEYKLFHIAIGLSAKLVPRQTLHHRLTPTPGLPATSTYSSSTLSCGKLFIK